MTNESLFAHYVATEDQATFAVLYDRLAPRLRIFLMKFFWQDQTPIDDVIQQTFINAHLNREQFNGKLFSAWIITIAENCAIDVARHLNRPHRKHQSLFGLVRSQFGDEFSYDPADEIGATPEQLAIADEDAEQAIAMLTGDDRVIFETIYVEELGYPEVAERLGVTINYARLKHLRMKRFLRAKLEAA